MYISQMHFGEGFAAGPDVDRRQLVASSALRPRCNFFSLRLSRCYGQNRPHCSRALVPTFSSSFYSQFHHPPMLLFCFLRDAASPSSSSITLLHDKMRASNMEERKENGKRQIRCTSRTTKTVRITLSEDTTGAYERGEEIGKERR